ncbi:MAG TPA: phosphatase domain-containing protein [Planctomycetota bacterium]|nr:phosphatase domain-containing protein [Planctomycetota bacterium]
MLITPYDLLVPLGEPATLEVEVEDRWMAFIDPPVQGVELEVAGVGRATSARNGLAAFDLGVLPEGTHRLEVRYLHKSIDALVRVIPRETPVIIVDIDETIANVTPAGFILRAVRNVRPLPGSREILKELAKTMQIVYLTARDHIFTRKTKLWLRLAGMPEGPVYLRKGTRYWKTPAREHKFQRLGELRKQFPNIPWGVGDKPGDAAAYTARGIRPILIAPGRPAEVSADVPCFPTWKNILDYIRMSERPRNPES